jgi:cyclopropane fatty-acyl-phospholipid synthase-like methyltransferase
MTPHPSPNTIMDLIAGHRVTAVIHVAAKLGLADLLTDGPRTAKELARLTDTHERSLLRLMRALCALGIFSETDGSTFGLTELGFYLTAKSERSVRAWALLEGEMLRAGWGEMIESIRTGKTANELAGTSPERFEEMARTNQAAAALFNEAMVSGTRMQIAALLAAYDFSGITTLMDVGGGLGELVSAIVQKYPSMQGIVFDLRHCEEAAVKNLAASGVSDRCRFIGGSFFESVPAGADAIIMKYIIHDWNDERCVQILRNCHHALKPGARLLVVDRIMPSRLEVTPDHLAVTLADLNMLRGPGGCERTEDEHRELLAKGGFRMTRIALFGRVSVIESVAK